MKDLEIETEDGSKTLFSSKYKQHFHDVKIGAINESLQKHVIPAFNYFKEKDNLNILDICFGIGYNTFSTIYYIEKENIRKNIKIFSPELDMGLINSLINFEYPKEFNSIRHIIEKVIKTKEYKSPNLSIELFIGDAREYIKNLKDIDIVYQDAFSSEVNKELWSVEYFKDIYKATSNESILTTYSIATNVRLSLFEAGFEIYEINPTGKKKQSMAFKSKIDINAKYIDMNLKKERNKEAKAIYD